MNARQARLDRRNARRVDIPRNAPNPAIIPENAPRVANDVELDDLAQNLNNRAVSFSLTPFQAITGVVNFGTSEGRKLYERATRALDDETYDGTANKLYAFLDNLGRRAQEFGWSDPDNGILMIPEDHRDLDSPLTNLLTNYGETTMAQIRAFEQSYIRGRNRAAQDSVMMHYCIMNSVTTNAKDTLNVCSNEYMVGNIPSGNLLLKVVIREFSIDTNATVSTVRLKLSNLDNEMLRLGCDIHKFNIMVKQQISLLSSRGQVTTDLLENLFKGYLSVKDNKFTEYIQSLQEDHEMGSKTVNANHLMMLAKIKYDIIREKGKWNAPTPEQQQILALQTKLATMEKKQSAKQSKNEDTNDANKQNRRRNRNRKGNITNNKPDWIFQPPKQEDVNKSRDWNNRTWWWCGELTGGKCERYRQHKGTNCQGRSYRANKRSSQDKNININDPQQDSSNARKSSDKKRLKLAKALAAIQQQNEEQSE